MVFSRLLLQAYLPSNWKNVNVTAIKNKNSNCRPISLLSQLDKAMERCVHKHMFNFISETYHKFLKAVDSGKEVRVVFCDISRAFDGVWHKGLLHKLACIGISRCLLRWLQSYLSNHRQRVVLNGIEYDWADVLAGVLFRVQFLTPCFS